MTNLSDQSLPQLKKLSAQITKEIETRQLNTKAHLLKRMRKLAKDAGLSLKDVLGASQPAPTEKAAIKRRSKPTVSKASAAKAKGPLKYRNPNDLTQGWSGRGRRPGWAEAWLANGGTLDALENAAASYKDKSKARKTGIAAPAEQADAVAPHVTESVTDGSSTQPAE